jgi:hypothetical protein
MKKPYRQADGFYHVDDKKYKTLFGSREQVMNGTVHKTTGGLTKEDLVMNKWGRIVSAKKFKTAKKEMRLQKYGFFAKKGKFGAVSRKMRGGKDSDVATVDPNVAPTDTTNVVADANKVADTNVVPPVDANKVAAEVPAATTNVVPNTTTTDPNVVPAAAATTDTNVVPTTTGGKSKKQNKTKKRR